MSVDKRKNYLTYRRQLSLQIRPLHPPTQRPVLFIPWDVQKSIRLRELPVLEVRVQHWDEQVVREHLGSGVHRPTLTQLRLQHAPVATGVHRAVDAIAPEAPGHPHLPATRRRLLQPQHRAITPSLLLAGRHRHERVVDDPIDRPVYPRPIQLALPEQGVQIAVQLQQRVIRLGS